MLVNKLKEIDYDLVILGGDIFDQIPTLAELEVFFNLIQNFSKPVIYYDGNHEATRKGKTFLTHLEKIVSKVCDSYFINEPKTLFDIDFLPYTHLHETPSFGNSRILCTHVRGDIYPHVKAEIDLNYFKPWAVVLAGDLHSHTNSQRNIVYPGSPMNITFHRNNTTNGVILFDTNSLEYDFIDLKLPKLLRKTVTTKEEIIETDYDYTIYELKNTADKLNNINSELLDKKILEKEYNSNLNLTNISMEEELKIYLKEIMKLDNIEEYINIYNDNIKESNIQ